MANEPRSDAETDCLFIQSCLSPHPSSQRVCNKHLTDCCRIPLQHFVRTPEMRNTASQSEAEPDYRARLSAAVGPGTSRPRPLPRI